MEPVMKSITLMFEDEYNIIQYICFVEKCTCPELDLRGTYRIGRPRGLHKREIESTDFIETFCSLKITTKWLVFLVIIRNTRTQKRET
jgi:hypothetical protein